MWFFSLTSFTLSWKNSFWPWVSLPTLVQTSFQNHQKIKYCKICIRGKTQGSPPTLADPKNELLQQRIVVMASYLFIFPCWLSLLQCNFVTSPSWRCNLFLSWIWAWSLSYFGQWNTSQHARNRSLKSTLGIAFSCLLLGPLLPPNNKQPHWETTASLAACINGSEAMPARNIQAPCRIMINDKDYFKHLSCAFLLHNKSWCHQDVTFTVKPWVNFQPTELMKK